MSDLGDYYRDLRDFSKDKRAKNRVRSLLLLKSNSISFVVKNDGAHIIIDHGGKIIDFWPGTGRWTPRHGSPKFGVFNLLSYLGVNNAGKKMH